MARNKQLSRRRMYMRQVAQLQQQLERLNLPLIEQRHSELMGKTFLTAVARSRLQSEYAQLRAQAADLNNQMALIGKRHL